MYSFGQMYFDQGLEKGLLQGREEGREEGRQKLNNVLFLLVQNGKLAVADAAEMLGISSADFLSLMKKAAYKAQQ